MRAIIKIIFSLLAAGLGACLFELLFQQLCQYDWLGYNIRMEDAEGFTLGYALLYLFIYFLFLFFRWPTTPKRVLVSSALILAASLLPVVILLTSRFWHTTLDLAGIYQRVQGSFASVFTTNLVVLTLVNLLFWWANRPASRPLLKEATNWKATNNA